MLPTRPVSPVLKIVSLGEPGRVSLVGRHASDVFREGWESVVLLTTQAHGPRVRIVVGRCFSGPIYVVSGSLSLGNWPYQIACERGVLLKALVLYRSC